MKIYAYTTETYKSKNWYKVGMAKNDVKSRINKQDNTACPEKLEWVKTWDDLPDHVLDFNVHNELINMGCERLRKNREWFCATIEDIDKAIKLTINRDPSAVLFHKISPFEKDEMCRRVTLETGLPRGSICNYENIDSGIAIARKTLDNMDQSKGFLLVWPSKEKNIREVSSKFEDWNAVAERNGVTLIMTKISDYTFSSGE